MWIAAATGVAPGEQGVASGMASTTLNIGNAVGLAVLIAVADAAGHGRAGARPAVQLADGSRLAVLLAAAGMLLGALATLRLPGRVRPEPQARPAPAPGGAVEEAGVGQEA